MEVVLTLRKTTFRTFFQQYINMLFYHNVEKTFLKGFSNPVFLEIGIKKKISLTLLYWNSLIYKEIFLHIHFFLKIFFLKGKETM